MISAGIIQPFKTNPVAWLLIALLATGAVPALYNYVILDGNVFIGIAMLPFIIQTTSNKRSLRYLLPLALLTFLVLLSPLKTLLFLLVVLNLFLVVESLIGKQNHLLLVVLITISPLFKFVTGLFSFPIRLWLSEVASILLSFTGNSAHAAGNLIYVNGAEFSVDPACAGLNMLATSILISILIITFSSRKYQTEISIFKTGIIVGLTILLNIISNLSRILILVIFEISPTNPFHDVIGIASLIIYVILPVILLSDKIIKRGNALATSEKSTTHRYALRLNFLVLATTFLSIFQVMKHEGKVAVNKQYTIKGYKSHILNTGVTKLENEKSLVYIKPLSFYNAEHNPAICWTGSGYEFKNIQKKTLNGITIYRGMLMKDESFLYTAWWFDNGKTRTVEQFTWRLEAITGEPFSLVNVTTASEEDLELELNKLLKAKIINNENE